MRVRKKPLVILTIFSVAVWIFTQNNIFLLMVFFVVTRWLDLFLTLKTIPKIKIERQITKTRLFVDEKAEMIYEISYSGPLRLSMKLNPSLSPVRFFKKDTEEISLTPSSSKKTGVRFLVWNTWKEDSKRVFHNDRGHIRNFFCGEGVQRRGRGDRFP